MGRERVGVRRWLSAPIECAVRGGEFVACGLLVAAALLVSMLALPVVASAEGCPNAVYRNGPSSLLPDCRAYEMVTPTYKEGFPVYLNITPFADRLSTDGTRVLGESLGVFAGAEDSHVEIENSFAAQGNSYVFTRGEAGWTTTAISPSAAQLPGKVMISASSDLSQSLWIGATPAQEEERRNDGGSATLEDFYIRAMNGPVVGVGPIMPPGVVESELPQTYFEFAGASGGDLAAVLFSSSIRHWPGDETEPGAESLYEYVGTGNSAPLLVGVSGGEGSTSLISKCGTRLSIAGGGGAPSSAISEDGNTVYFTALACGSSPLVQELYARVDNGQSDAHTVAISEPSGEVCGECETSEGARRAAFAVGASPDGSKAFFTTTQPLLGDDESNNLYEYDAEEPQEHRIVRVSSGDATVVKPTANVEGVVAISPDGSHVYFTAGGVLTRTPNSLGQVPEAGASNLYLYERDAQYPGGRTVFVLPGADYGGGSISQNGRFLVFNSFAHLTSDDLSPGAQAFEYDSQTGGFVRVSIGRDGFNDDGNTASVRKLLVADDGAVFFETATPLAPQAVSEQSNVYEYREGNVNLISTGEDAHGVTLTYISPLGTDVFFQTFEQLVPRDTDSQEDLYDARVDGGFAEPPPPPECEADACQGALSGAPVLLSPGSEFQAGGENVISGAGASEPTMKAVKAKAKGAKGRQRTRGKKRRKDRAKKARRSIHSPIGASAIGGVR